jgi:hypothetical protein
MILNVPTTYRNMSSLTGMFRAGKHLVKSEASYLLLPIDLTRQSPTLKLT